jgi:hypothetical protein
MPRLIRGIIGKAAFWKFAKEMEETYYSNQWWIDKNFDWSKPLSYCPKVLAAINKDKPLR